MDVNLKSDASERELSSARDVVDYLDELDRAVDRIQLCGAGNQ
jgi:hypothetical protein